MEQSLQCFGREAFADDHLALRRDRCRSHTLFFAWRLAVLMRVLQNQHFGLVGSRSYQLAKTSGLREQAPRAGLTAVPGMTVHIGIVARRPRLPVAACRRWTTKSMTGSGPSPRPSSRHGEAISDASWAARPPAMAAGAQTAAVSSPYRLPCLTTVRFQAPCIRSRPTTVRNCCMADPQVAAVMEGA